MIISLEIATCAPDKPEKWEGSCKKWKNKGYCTTDKYIDFMKENCDTTCNCSKYQLSCFLHNPLQCYGDQSEYFRCPFIHATPRKKTHSI